MELATGGSRGHVHGALERLAPERGRELALDQVVVHAARARAGEHLGRQVDPHEHAAVRRGRQVAQLGAEQARAAAEVHDVQRGPGRERPPGRAVQRAAQRGRAAVAQALERALEIRRKIVEQLLDVRVGGLRLLRSLLERGEREPRLRVGRVRGQADPVRGDRLGVAAQRVREHDAEVVAGVHVARVRPHRAPVAADDVAHGLDVLREPEPRAAVRGVEPRAAPEHFGRLLLAVEVVGEQPP